MQTRTQKSTNKWFSFSFFWPGSQVAPAPTPVVTPQKPTELTAEISRTASNSPSNDLALPPKKLEKEKRPEKMLEIYALRRIENYIMHYLDHVAADSLEDDSQYKLNRSIILDMIKHGKDLIALLKPPYGEEYIEKIKLYDKAIKSERKRFNLACRSKEYEQHIPSVKGEKSEQLAYLYLQYLDFYANINSSTFDKFRAEEITKAQMMSAALRKKVTLKDDSNAIIQMRTTIKLRKKRENELKSPSGQLEIEKKIAALPDTEKEIWLHEVAKRLYLLNIECRAEINNNPKKFPALTLDCSAEYLEDLLYSRAHDDFLFIRRCPEEDYKKYLAFRNELKCKENDTASLTQPSGNVTPISLHDDEEKLNMTADAENNSEEESGDEEASDNEEESGDDQASIHSGYSSLSNYSAATFASKENKEELRAATHIQPMN